MATTLIYIIGVFSSSVSFIFPIILILCLYSKDTQKHLTKLNTNTENLVRQTNFMTHVWYETLFPLYLSLFSLLPSFIYFYSPSLHRFSNVFPPPSSPIGGELYLELTECSPYGTECPAAEPTEQCGR